MAVSDHSDRFIPFSKSDVIEMCLKDAQMTEAEAKGFRDFCRILETLFHFIWFTAETQSTQRENPFIKNRCALCVSAVSYSFSHFFFNPLWEDNHERL